jgi:hypothetical protein
MGRTRTIIGLAAVFVVAFAGTAVANHIYSDVPTNSVFHDEIAEIGDQGCAEGFPGGLFKPNDPVKRQQMARFLSRCGGRAASDDGSVGDMIQNHLQNIATVDFTARADGYVLVTGNGWAQTSQASSCPCKVTFRLDDSLMNVHTTQGTLGGAATSDGNVYENMTISHLYTVGQGQEVVYSLGASYTDPELNNIQYSGELTVTYFPFDGTTPTT